MLERFSLRSFRGHQASQTCIFLTFCVVRSHCLFQTDHCVCMCLEVDKSDGNVISQEQLTLQEAVTETIIIFQIDLELSSLCKS